MVAHFLIDDSQQKISNIEEVLKGLQIVKKSPIESRILKRFVAGCFLSAEREFAKRNNIVPSRLVSIREIVEEGKRTRFALQREVRIQPIKQELVMQPSPITVSKPKRPEIKKETKSKKELPEVPIPLKENIIEFNNFKIPTTINGMYIIKEPLLTETDLRILEELKKKTFFYDPKSILTKEGLIKKLNKISKKYNLQLTPEYINSLDYYIHRDLEGLGRIEIFLHDDNIKKVISDSSTRKVLVEYNKEKINTNVMFKDKEEMNDLIQRLAEQCKKKVSEKEPFLEGSLPFGAKIQATYGSDYTQASIILTK